MPYERLRAEASKHNVLIYEMPMPPTIKGLYADNIIWINRKMNTQVEKACILAEELGHYHTSSGNILDQSDIRNRKQELRARQWAYQCMLPLDKIVQAYQARICGRYELSEFLEVTEEFLQTAIDRYTAKYGLYVRVDKKYTICFEPLRVIEYFV